jgi:MraZ protein
VFRGVNTINLDDKGRLAIPTRYRSRLQTDAQGQLIVTIDTEVRCLLLYPLPEWEGIEKKIEALPSFNRDARRIQRLLMGHATELEIDSHGRVLLPPSLREYANLQKATVLVGQGKKFEIWDEKNWQDTREVWIKEGMGKGGSLPPELEVLSL